MLTGIDHIVVVVANLRAAADHFEKLGFTVVPGGKHPVGSHNILISFGDGSYLEVIAFYQDSPEHRWWQPLQQGEGLVDYCMQTGDLVGDTRKLRAAGVDIKDPVPWSRTRPDGYELKWLLSLAQKSHRGVAPFLIQDITPREERVPQKFEHNNRVTGIATVTIAVDDLMPVGRWYREVLGVEGIKIQRAELRASGLRFTVGPNALELLKPDNAQSALHDCLKARGPSPFSATLRSATSRNQTLDPALTHGARLAFE